MKNDFPIFKTYPDLVYLDSAATAQKPQEVIDAVSNVYQKYNANIHRGIYDLSEQTTALFENTREKVAKFIGAKNPAEIIFTSGTTESINLVASGWAKEFLKKGDIIVLSEMEHHSNIVPWLRLQDEIGIELFYLPLTKEYRLDYTEIGALPLAVKKRIKFVALTHASNVLGTVNPLEEIIPYFRKHTPDAKILIDAAQSVQHLPIDVTELDCDFFVFSSHKLFGPSGVGVLYAKKELLEVMIPLLVGSHMIKKVTKEYATWTDIPDKFEPGTRNIEGVIGLGAAIDYMQKITLEKIKKYEKELTEYALDMFCRQKKVTLFGPKTANERVSVFSFLIDDIHPHDTAEILNRMHVAVRAGHHCAQPLMDVLCVSGIVRASLSLYNTKEDIDRLEEGIKETKETFKT